MDAKRQADELTSRCVALVIFYQHASKSRSNESLMNAEFRAVASEARRIGVSPALIASNVLTELGYRYEPTVAARLHRVFLAEFSHNIQFDAVPAKVHG